MKKLVIITMLFAVVFSLNAQLRIGDSGTNLLPSDWSWSPNSWNWNPNNYSLLNPNNYSMNHSMSFATSYSNGLSFYQSTYTNHISYQVNKDLDINVDLHFTNFGSANISDGFNIESNGDNTSDIVPDFSVEYRPTENTTINFVYKGGYPGRAYNRFYDWRD